MLYDANERLLATDPTQSFIVQAPAGSGKTEILTQRYLRLLGTVTHPEQIVALTFTKKAANEMRERILNVFQEIADGISASSPHREQTHAYAMQALAQDKAHQWQLLQQPGRLRILTIDALCQAIASAIPLQDKQIPFAQITDKPQIHYNQAAKLCLQHAIETPDYQPAIKTLLTHLDNRQDVVLDLLSQLLATRDQWLGPFYQAKTLKRSFFEQALCTIEQHELARFRQIVPKTLQDELVYLARLMADVETNPLSPRSHLSQWVSFDTLDGKIAASLCALLLTSTNTLRKAFDHHVGLRRGAIEDTLYNTIKTSSKQLLNQLDLCPDFLPALIRIRHLPKPYYDESQWQVLEALFALLPLLVAHLHLVFSNHLEVDFTAVSLFALQALGDEDNPTDLGLYLDNRIHHLLVDEFQDTSIQQFELLSRLVQGFQPGDGKTVFIVGDPMQSIYRFRAAEVGLFLKAKEQGLGPVVLHPLELSCNFRSTPTLVDWINTQFQTIFPVLNDIESGAIAFHPSMSTRTQGDDFIQAYQYTSPAQEAKEIARFIKDELVQYPNDTIAILVRSRNQLSAIIGTLKNEGIPFQGVDIDLLAELPHLRDVYSLTKALLSPANRLAWLSVLRSPWCGLSLQDLHVIANVSPLQSIYEILAATESIEGLSEDGRIRAQFIYQVLHHALTNRHQHSLVDWLRQTLDALHLCHILNEKEEQDLEQYWVLLTKFEKNGLLTDLNVFKQEFNKLYSQTSTPARLQIMTIHKSKGLEFDCVMLPGLGGRAQRKEAKLLRFLKIPTNSQEELLLLSPIKAAYQKQCALTDYLNELEEEKSQYEQQRLLYVAVTRARKRLYLFDHHQKSTSGSFKDMLKGQKFISQDQDEKEEQIISHLPYLYRLPTDFYKSYTGSSLIKANPIQEITDDQDAHKPKLIGIVTHELLQWICTYHPRSLEEIPWEMGIHQFMAYGFSGEELAALSSQVKKQITTLWNNPIGQWIIKPHMDEQNEYACLIEDHQDVVTRIVDRTFREDNKRWIIDFKTGLSTTISEHNHRQQLNDYARLFLPTQDTIYCGLYYLETERWITWEYQLSLHTESDG